MLRRRNKLMKCRKIGREIAHFNSVELRRLDTATGTKELWAAVGKLTGAQEQPATEPTITAEELNIQFASTSTDVSYQPPIWRSTASPSLQIFNDRQIFDVLDHLRHTAAGMDGVPAWYLRILAPICSGWLTRLFNLSLCQSWVQLNWKLAIIHPVPKIKSP